MLPRQVNILVFFSPSVLSGYYYLLYHQNAGGLQIMDGSVGTKNSTAGVERHRLKRAELPETVETLFWI